MTLLTDLEQATEGSRELDGDEKPKDWYCGRCSEVVPLGERCRICGAEKRESGVA